ncbi:poly(R)-hydroxyalkanoic acid synthase, class III, PhaE subunit [Beggiatoa alba B18LD]|uniref:Poly(3-hydroxyalkanoate) polymerase subunit PhaE n=1 Tax=Beggiatoa alba B18LD TaxID=395493 RepID=I3CFU5_9GAMM|nr:class III poly(R)-hydroxyalkanoic acid synthase subunit PhaE [Beggiatoa alba]EIJ42488.1 poly(R)-hydroxyalkanoic acid synthase, class III, PhaE subunit [Beggiatoa alba B18LD]
MKDNNSAPAQTPWLTLQQQYWDMWLNLTRQLLQAKADTASTDEPDSLQNIAPWLANIELWWQALSPIIPSENQTILRKFIDQGKNYFQFNQEFFEIFQSFKHDGDDTEESILHIETALQTLRDNLLKYLQEQKNVPGFWNLPLDNWGRTFSALSQFPSDFLQNVKTGLKPEQLAQQEKLEHLLSMPAVGYTREWQTQIQKGLQLLLNYQAAQQDYNHQFQLIIIHTVALLRDRLLQHVQQKTAINSLRVLYDEWVECGELAYADIVKTDEYSEVNARLLNSLMTWKQHEQRMIDEILGTLNMPTRRGLNTLHKRMQEMRREIKKTQTETSEPSKEVLSYEDLKDEIKVLRAEVELIKRTEKIEKKNIAPRQPPKPTDKPS